VLSITRDILFLFVSFLAGVAMAAQGTLNAAVSKAIGLSESTFVVHLTATMVMIIILVMGFGRGNWAKLCINIPGITMRYIWWKDHRCSNYLMGS
jgi:uncharacterized membrane protein YdcZ (DUF606 family)